MSGPERRIELSWTKSDYMINDNQVLLAAAFICRRDKTDPLEVIDMLGLTDDLSRVRSGLRQRSIG